MGTRTKVWTSERYFLYGTYCDDLSIRTKLQDLARQLKARGSILIVHDHDALIGTLSFCSGTIAAEEPNLRTWDFRPENSLFAASVLAEREGVPPGISFSNGESRHPLIHDGLGGVSKFAFAARSSRGLSILVVHNGHSGKASREVRAEAESLLEMVNATAQAEARRDSIVMRTVRQELRAAGSATGPESSFESSALTVGLAVTESTYGGIYAFDVDNPDVLVLTASLDSNRVLPASLPVEHSQVVKRAVQSGRQMRSLYAGATNLCIADGGVSELITPINAATDPGSATGYGLLILGRALEREYSAYEEALARNLGLRLMAHLEEGRQRLLATIIQAIAVHDVGSSSCVVDDDIPTDLRTASPAVSVALEQLMNATNSHSATLRMLLPVAGSSDPSHLGLVRISSASRYQLVTRKVQFPGPDVGGRNWAAVRMGVQQYTEDTDRDVIYTRHRDNSRSALATPVRMDGRVVGVVNLESSLVHNYAPMLVQIELFCSAIGSMLSREFARHTLPGLERTSLLLGRAHEMDRVLIEIEKNPSSIEPQVTQLRVLLNGVLRRRSETEGRTSADVPIRHLDRLTILDVLNGAIRFTKVQVPIVERVPGVGGRCLEPESAAALFVGASNVLANMRRHAEMDEFLNADASDRRLTVDVTHLGGQAYAAVDGRNRSADVLDPERVMALYRLPVLDKSEGLRLGAFITGLHLRSMGGYAHCFASPDLMHLTATLLVPTPTDGAENV